MSTVENACDWAEIYQLKSAYAWHYLLDFVLAGGADEPVLRVMGVYDERYRREDGPWKIAHMHLAFLWNSDVGRIRPGEERKLEWHADAVAD
jgi:SnoaL-like domain